MDGLYGRWNWKAMMSLVAGVAVALIGLVVPGLRVLYDYAWFVGFGVAFVLYVILMRGTPVLDLNSVEEV
jgi:NCS1 family nucleobase:cation symporter-1